MMDERTILLDESTGLYVGWYFWLRVLDEVNRSTRYGVPFALLLLDINAAPSMPPRQVEEAAGTVRKAVRATDLAGRIGPGRTGVLLPHQDVASAALARARIVGSLDGLSPRGFAWEARLLCYPGDGAEISRLLAGPGVRASDTLAADVGESA